MTAKKMSPGRRDRRYREAYLTQKEPEVFLDSLCSSLRAGDNLGHFLAKMDLRINTINEWLASDVQRWEKVQEALKSGRGVRRRRDLAEISRFQKLEVELVEE